MVVPILKNPGLKRRFPWTFSINEFGVEELMNVLKIKIESSEWEYEDSFDKVKSLISQNKQYLTGNGGDIENILAKAKIINIRKNFLNNDKTLSQDDIIESINQFLLTRKETNNEPPYGMYT